MDFFERAIELCEDRKPLKSLEFFSRKKSKCASRYGTKKPVEKVNKQEMLLAWREGDL